MVRCRFLLVFLLICIAAGVPCVPGSNTLIVGPGTGYQYNSIQAAINDAHTNDIIVAAPGLYNERITIDKAITLQGATAGEPKKGYAVPDGYRYDSTKESVIAPQDAQNAPVVTISSRDVTIDGFVISMTAAGSYPDYAASELVRMTATGNLDRVRILNNVIGPNTNLTVQDGNAGRMGITIAKWSPGTGDNKVRNLEIRNNKIFDAKGDGCGILMIGAKNTSADSLQNQFAGAVIDNNEISGNHRSGIDFSAGVQGGPEPENHIKITNNLITGNGWNGTVDADNIKWGNGIVLIRMTNQLNDELPWAARYVDIENNEFSGNEKNGIYIGPVTRDVTIRNNVIRDNGRGTSPEGVSGYNTSWDGIRIDLDEQYQIEELARHPEQGTWNGRRIYDYLTGIDISGNRISGNGGHGLNVIRTPQIGPVDAENNWWGDASGPVNMVSNPGGTGDAVSVNARYVPWYGDEAMTVPVTPEGGAGPILVVGTGNFTAIQPAINAAQDGDAITVSPGLYNERIVINRSVRLLGAGAGISKKDYAVPPSYAYDETKESIIHPSGVENSEVVGITTGSVLLDGFVITHTDQGEYPLYPVTHLIGLGNASCNYDNVRIVNNVIGPNTDLHHQSGAEGRSGIAVYGPYSTTMYNLTIADNRIFDAKGDGCGILLLGSINTTAAPGLAGKYRGSVIDNNTITGNHRSGIEFSGGVQGTEDPAGRFRITNNTISYNGWRSESEKTTLKYGNGIVLIHVGSDRENPDAWGSEYLDIGNNRIEGNEKNGIYLGPVNRNISIANNTIRFNGAGLWGYDTWDGIRVDLDERYHNPLYRSYGFLADIAVHQNEINASGNYGVQVIGTPERGPVDARLNWWGDGSGPKADDNPDGRANPVSGNVLFSPWYRDGARTIPSDLPAPVADFTATPRSGNAPLVVTFTDTSTGMPETRAWDFGDHDDTNASMQNPVHRYRREGRYTVRLTVTNATTGSNTTQKQDYISVSPPIPPVADFSAAPTAGTAPLHVNFTDLSTGPITYWFWDVDQTNSSMECSGRLCNYTYTKAGSYNVTLTVSGDEDFDTLTRPGYITVHAAPVANFTAAPLSGTAPLLVAFTDASEGLPERWLWDFGDNDNTNASVQNPVHRYHAPGLYTVRLAVTNATSGSNITEKRQYIAVASPGIYPVASFTWSPFEGMAGETFSFDASETAAMSRTGIRSYRWDFGDGNGTAATADPLASHVFVSSRVSTVTLHVIDVKGMTNQTQRQVSVIAKKEPIPIAFNGTNVSGEAGSQVVTINTTASSGTVTNTTTGVTITNPGNGWAAMELKGNTTLGENGELVVSNITEVVLKTVPAVTTLGDGNSGPGNVTTAIDLALKQFVEAPLEVDVTQGANATIADGFRLAAGSGNVVDAIAYTMTIKGSSLVNSNLSGTSDPVRLTMSVSEEWVRSHGGIGAIKVLRYSDDGTTKETLDTRYMNTSGTPPMCYFEIVSPHGLSVFGIASVIPAPPSPAPASGGVPAIVEAVGIADSSERSELPATVAPAMRTTAPVMTTAQAGTLQAGSATVQEEPAWEPAGTAGTGTAWVPQNIPADMLSFMEENLLKMTMLAGAACIGTALMLWYRNQTRWG